MNDQINLPTGGDSPSAPTAPTRPQLDPLPDLSRSADAPFSGSTVQDPVPVVTPPVTPTPPTPTAPSAKRRGCGGCALLIAAISGALLGAVLGTFIILNIIGVDPSQLAERVERPPIVANGEPVMPPAATPQPRTDLETSEQVAEKVVPSVVNISIETAVYDPWTGNQQNQTAGNGSGSIIDAQGHILTNAHVVAGSQNLIVTVGNRDYPAEIVGVDPSSDIAVIKIDATDLTPIELGDSGSVKVGQWVMAVGSPFGLEKSVTTGIVSALKRSETMQLETGSSVYSNMIQVDAAINPGNSGGALVDAEGRLIGMPTLIQSTSGQSAGVGFAIPVNYAMQIAEQLIESGSAIHPFLGVSVQTVDAALATEYGLSVNNGAYIATVEPGSAAESAGIAEGDVVVEIAGTRIRSADDLLVEIRGHRPGDRVEITLYRGTEERMVTATLGSDTR